MAEFRQIHTRIWKDNWFSELEMDAKVLFIYLFSNERASVCGMYELPLKYIAFETGIPAERVTEIMGGFAAADKAYFENGVVWVKNLRKYNETSSDKVAIRIAKDLEGIPDCELKKQYYLAHKIPYPYGIDTFPHRDGDGDGDRDRNGEGGTPPAAPRFSNAADPEAHRLFWEVTGMVAIPASEEEKVTGAIRQFLSMPDLNHNGLVVYLKPFYEAWKAAGHSKTNCAWLYDRAVAGEMPKPKSNGNGHKKVEKIFQKPDGTKVTKYTDGTEVVG